MAEVGGGGGVFVVWVRVDWCLDLGGGWGWVRVMVECDCEGWVGQANGIGRGLGDDGWGGVF